MPELIQYPVSFWIARSAGRAMTNCINISLLWICCIALVLLCFCFVAQSEAFKLPDTGQTKCYQGVSPYAEIPCAGTGQDGEYNINPLSYTDNGNGTVTDNNTGLMWQKQDDGNTYNWYQAAGVYDVTYNSSSKNVCGELRIGNYSDWRLPSNKELMSIVDYSIPYPGPTVNPIFADTKQSFYWSSIVIAFNSAAEWDVSFSDGYVGNHYKYYGNYVRCVRDVQHPTLNFVNNGNGTVTDTKSGLVWQQGEPGAMTWSDRSQLL
jgi:hypothetical protein